MRLLPLWEPLCPSAGCPARRRSTTNRAPQPTAPKGSTGVLCCCFTSPCLDLRTFREATRTQVHRRCLSSRRSRQVIRDFSDHRCGTSATDTRPYSREVPAARRALVEPAARPCEPILAPLARLGSWPTATVHRRARVRRTTGTLRHTQTTTACADGTPRFQTRGVRIARPAER